MNRQLLGVLVAFTLGANPAPAQTESQAEKANYHFNKGTDLIIQGDPQAALLEFKAARKLADNWITYGGVISATWFIASGGTLSPYNNGTTYYYKPAARSRNPQTELALCPLLRQAASNGSVLASSILDHNWRDCRDKGDLLYLADDGIIRIRGTARSGGGMSQGNTICLGCE